MNLRVRWLGFLACACAFLTACEFDRTSVPVGQSQVVVQAVLDPDAVPQVLVERTLSGGVTVRQSKDYDPADPINSSGGIPVAGATVTIAAGGQTWVALATAYPGKPASYGAGRYLTSTVGPNSLVVHPGARYTVRVNTPDGVTVTGTTYVPNVAPVGVDTFTLFYFNRDHDTLRVGWPTGVGARTYGLSIDSPFAGFLTFTDSTQYTIPGNLQNVFSSSFRRVFIPGFTQTVTVYAADTNYFDYYRSINDPFTGSGIINRLTGGLGLFGSIVVMHTTHLLVTQDPREPAFEGGYQLVSLTSPSQIQFSYVRLYIESGDSASASLSGYSVNGVALLGTRTGKTVQLQFLTNQDASRVVARFAGTWSHDSLIGTFSGSAAGNAVFKACQELCAPGPFGSAARNSSPDRRTVSSTSPDRR